MAAEADSGIWKRARIVFGKGSVGSNWPVLSARILIGSLQV